MLLHTFISSQIIDRLSTPILAPVFQDRPTGIAIVGAAVLHSGLTILGLPSWQCPVRYTLGVPCPGCGLSRATIALIHGDWETSLTYHAFAPLFLIGLLLTAFVTFLPSNSRHHAINWVGYIERYTGVTAIFLLSLVLYWLARMLILREAFFNLIMG